MFKLTEIYKDLTSMLSQNLVAWDIYTDEQKDAWICEAQDAIDETGSYEIQGRFTERGIPVTIS